jgi:hypothetical protein
MTTTSTSAFRNALCEESAETGATITTRWRGPDGVSWYRMLWRWRAELESMQLADVSTMVLALRPILRTEVAIWKAMRCRRLNSLEPAHFRG